MDNTNRNIAGIGQETVMPLVVPPDDSLRKEIRQKTGQMCIRDRFPIVLIDAYWSAEGEPFCPAADGLSHHINPAGYIEPCPCLLYTSNMGNSYAQGADS